MGKRSSYEYDDGAAAAELGQSRDSNPFDMVRQNERHNSWDLGFLEYKPNSEIEDCESCDKQFLTELADHLSNLPDTCGIDQSHVRRLIEIAGRL